MPATKRSLPKELSKPIVLSDAPACGLRLQLGALPDQSDINSYASSEVHRRIEALDADRGLDRNASDLYKQRLKAIIEQVYEVPADSPYWECQAFAAIFMEHIVKFSAVEKGRPSKWTDDVLIVLHADAQKLKAKYPELWGDDFYIALRTRHRRTWGQFSNATLRKAYSRAKKIARRYPIPAVTAARI